MFYFPQGLLCVPAEDKMTQKTLKYRMLLKAFRMLPVKRIMAWTPEKSQKIFKKAYKRVEIPELHDPEISVSRGEVKGQAVLYYRHRKETDRVGIYLVGGGMLKYPKPSQAGGLVSLAKETGINILLPYYPLVFEGSTLTDVYEMLYELYKKTLRKYRPENICFMGGSSGGNLAIGMASYINDRGEGLPMPGKIYAGSPGTLLLTEEEKRRAGELEKTDVIMSVKATENIWGIAVNPENHKEGYSFHLIGCPIAKHAKENGYEELLPHLCQTDHVLAEVLHARLIRTQTEILGGPYCDYWYVGDRFVTGDGPNVI